MREMKDSGVEWMGKVPENWNIVALKFLCSMQSGKTLSSEQISEEGKYPVYGGNGLRGYYSEANTFGNYLLVGRQGALCGNVHHVQGEFWATEHAVVTKCSALSDVRYMYYLLLGMNLNQYASNTAAQPGLAVSQIINVKTCLAPIQEQKLIAVALDEKCAQVDTLIANVKAQIEKLKAYRQRLITEVVTKGLDPTVPMKDSGVEWIGKIAETHTIFRLKYLLDSPMQYGANESGDKFIEDSVRYIRITDITADGKLKNDENNQYLPLDAADGYILKNKDVLFARSGGTVGKSFLYQEDYGTSAFAGYLIKAECDQSALLPEYLIYYSQSSLYELWKNMIFIQATIQNIGANKYSNMEIPVPSIDEQATIVEYLEGKCAQIDRLIAIKQAKIEKLEQYKRSLIYEYVTGKKEVR